MGSISNFLGMFPTWHERACRWLRGLLSSLRARSEVSPETYELDGVATTARLTLESATGSEARTVSVVIGVKTASRAMLRAEVMKSIVIW